MTTYYIKKASFKIDETDESVKVKQTILFSHL
jgi:hypothetical protein